LGHHDRWDGIPEFIGSGKVIRNPRRVTYRQMPELDHPEVSLVHDGAYWVSDIVTREDERSGLVDATSLADGYAPPEIGTFRNVGTEPRPHLARGVQWETPPIDGRRPPENALEVSLEGVESTTVWVEEAGLDPDEEITVRIESGEAATLTLASAFGTYDLEVPEGDSIHELQLAELEHETAEKHREPSPA
jgi:hypothetical protein